MIEKNRDILKKALDALPKREASASSWDAVAKALDQLAPSSFAVHHNLPKHKAPAGAWSVIEKKLGAPWFTFFSNPSFKNISLVIFLFAFLGGVFCFWPDQKEEIKLGDKTVLPLLAENENQKKDDKKNNLVKIEKKKSQKEQGGPLFKNTDQAKASNIKEAKHKNTEFPSGKPNGNKNVQDAKSGFHGSPINASGNSVSRIENQSSWKKKSNDFRKIKGHKNGLFNLKLNLFHKKNRRPASYHDGSKDYYRNRMKIDFSIAAHYSLINYQNVSIDAMEIPESVSCFGLEFMFSKNRFILKTGLTYLGWQEKGEYIFDYKQNELVYSYHYVDSANIDPNSGATEYFTSDRNVFDSIAHQQNTESKYKYRILQTPLIFGFKILERNNFFLSLNAGLGIDLRLSGKQYKPIFSNAEASITNIDNLLQYRTDLNWRLIGSLGLYYHITKNISFYLEPGFQQYMKPVYQSSKLKKVAYIEFKTGLVFNF
jgi:hypothetical protein